jgi:hypothetical protein
LENRKQNWFFWVVVGVGISGEREKVEEIVWEGKYMYVNGKMIPVETVLGMGEGEIKENGTGGEFN